MYSLILLYVCVCLCVIWVYQLIVFVELIYKSIGWCIQMLIPLTRFDTSLIRFQKLATEDCTVTVSSLDFPHLFALIRRRTQLYNVHG